tara:strand:+ start:1400 stop:1750 length:351 start_codon:yes stop_codon:yes gene_type:complete
MKSMSNDVILNPAFHQPAGFTQNQFRKLDQLYCMTAAEKVLTYRTVECDFDDGIASYTYFKTEVDSPYLQFVIRKVGPRATHFELYKKHKGCIAKSSIFERTYEKLREEIEKLFEE